MFDALPGDAAPALGALAAMTRTELADGAWVDHRPGWLTGSDLVLGTLLERVPWRAEQRRMYDRQVAVPRLLCWYNGATPCPRPLDRSDPGSASSSDRSASDERGLPSETSA